MELSQLRALRELRDRGSIAAVAASMQVTSSSVSQQLAALQRKAGVQLTQRQGRRTVLTGAGMALAAAVVEVEQSLARAHSAVASYNASQQIVSVCAFLSAARSLGPSLVGAIGGPQVTLSDQDVATEDFPALVLSHDLVIAHRLEGSPPWPAHVAVRALMAEPLDIAFREGHRLASLPRLTSRDLAAESWIAVHRGFPLEEAVLRLVAPSGTDASIVHRINDFGTTASILAKSDHVALLPRFLTREYPGIQLVPVSGDLGAPPIRRVDLLARPEAFERAAVMQVADRLLAAARAVQQPY